MDAGDNGVGPEGAHRDDDGWGKERCSVTHVCGTHSQPNENDQHIAPCNCGGSPTPRRGDEGRPLPEGDSGWLQRGVRLAMRPGGPGSRSGGPMLRPVSVGGHIPSPGRTRSCGVGGGRSCPCRGSSRSGLRPGGPRGTSQDHRADLVSAGGVGLRWKTFARHATGRDLLPEIELRRPIAEHVPAPEPRRDPMSSGSGRGCARARSMIRAGPSLGRARLPEADRR